MGSGNNASDGFLIAGLLAAKGLRLFVSDRSRARTRVDAWDCLEFAISNGVSEMALDEALIDADVIVDALRTGISGPVRPDLGQAIRSK